MIHSSILFWHWELKLFTWKEREETSKSWLKNSCQPCFHGTLVVTVKETIGLKKTLILSLLASFTYNHKKQTWPLFILSPTSNWNLPVSPINTVGNVQFNDSHRRLDLIKTPTFCNLFLPLLETDRRHIISDPGNNIGWVHTLYWS